MTDREHYEKVLELFEAIHAEMHDNRVVLDKRNVELIIERLKEKIEKCDR